MIISTSTQHSTLNTQHSTLTPPVLPLPSPCGDTSPTPPYRELRGGKSMERIVRELEKARLQVMPQGGNPYLNSTLHTQHSKLTPPVLPLPSPNGDTSILSFRGILRYRLAAPKPYGQNDVGDARGWKRQQKIPPNRTVFFCFNFCS
jgi:hypothetical protein